MIKMIAMMLGSVLLAVASFTQAASSCVNCTCLVATTPLNFGRYNSLNTTTTQVTGAISVTCRAFSTGSTVAYHITLDPGSSGTFTARVMRNGPAKLQYNIYTNSANSVVWGDGTATTGTISDAYLADDTFTTRHYTLYGFLPGAQSVPPGVYTDALTATVVF